MNKKIKTILAAGLLTLGMAAQACTLAAWDDGANVLAGGPAEGGANNFSRYSGLCSMKSDSANAGRVINDGDELGVASNNGPANEAKMIARFYFLAEGTGSGIIFQAFSDDAETIPVYTVTFDGTDVTVTPNDGGTDTAVASVGATNWHSVEIEWNQGGVINLWVDTHAISDSPAADAGTSGNATTEIESVALGGANTFTSVIFDDYESRRNNPIGRLQIANVDNDEFVTGADAILILREGSGVLTNDKGVPDVDRMGWVDGTDAILALRIASGILVLPN